MLHTPDASLCYSVTNNSYSMLHTHPMPVSAAPLSADSWWSAGLSAGTAGKVKANKLTRPAAFDRGLLTPTQLLEIAREWCIHYSR